MEIRGVSPKTQYPGGKEADNPLGYIEILVRNQKSNEAIVVGNLAVSLLVKQQDYLYRPSAWESSCPANELSGVS